MGPRQHLEEDQPKGEDVGAGIDRLPAQLLGRHVGGRAHRLAGGRDPRQGLGIGGGEALGHAEVHHLDVTIGGQHHVGRLKVAVDEAAVVRDAEGLGDLGR